MDVEEIFLRILEIQKTTMVFIYALADGYGINWNDFSENAKEIEKLVTEIKKSNSRR